jgi:hypothetical protein
MFEEKTQTSSPNEENSEIKYLRKQENLCQQLRKVNDILNSNISISLLNLISENKLKKNFKHLLKKQKNLIFNLKQIPKISVGDFIYRITYYSKIEDSTLISGLILLDRYCKKQKIILTIFNVHRLISISIIVAIKLLEDKYFTNKYYSKICGIDFSLFNQLEYEFICGLNFNLYIEKNFYYKYQNLLLSNKDDSN